MQFHLKYSNRQREISRANHWTDSAPKYENFNVPVGVVIDNQLQLEPVETMHARTENLGDLTGGHRWSTALPPIYHQWSTRARYHFSTWLLMKMKTSKTVCAPENMGNFFRSHNTNVFSCTDYTII